MDQFLVVENKVVQQLATHSNTYFFKCGEPGLAELFFLSGETKILIFEIIIGL